MRNRRIARPRRRHRSVFDRSEHMRQVQKSYKGPRGKINPKDLFGFDMGEMVEFTHPKTGEHAYGKVVEWKRTPSGILAELSVKATLNEDGDWIRYKDFYDFQYVPVQELKKSPRGLYEERTRRRARAMLFRRRRRAAGPLEIIFRYPELVNHFKDVLTEIAEEVNIFQDPELEDYEYAEGVVPFAGYIQEFLKQYNSSDLDPEEIEVDLWQNWGPREIEDIYFDVAQAFIQKYGEEAVKKAWRRVGSTRKSRKMKRRQAAAETLTYDPSYSGIGKFNSNIDEQVYDWSAEGWGSEQIGTAEHFGYHELVEIPEGVLVKQPEGDWTFQAAILAEDSQGFVYVTYYDTVEDGRKAWAEVEADYDAYLEEVRRENPDLPEDELY